MQTSCDKLGFPLSFAPLDPSIHRGRITSTFPLDLWAYIFTMVPSQQRLSLRRVCYLWNAIAFRAVVIKKLFAEHILPIRMHYFFLFHPLFREMNATHKGNGLSIQFLEQDTFLPAYALMAHQYPEISSLKFQNFVDCSMMRATLNRTTNLGALTIQHLSHEEKGCDCNLPLKLSNLSSLHISQANEKKPIADIFTYSPHLVSVTLAHTGSYWLDPERHFFGREHFPTTILQELEHLNCQRFYLFTSLDFALLFQLAKRLNCLELSELQLEDSCLLEPQTLTGLTQLSLKDIRKLTTYGLANLLARTSLLTRLYLDSIACLNESALDISLRSLGQLSTLELHRIHCTPVTERGLKSTLEVLTNLTTLSLSSERLVPSDLTGSCLDLQNPKALARLRNFSVDKFPSFRFQGLIDTFTRHPKPLLLQNLRLEELKLKETDLAPLFSRASFLTTLKIGKCFQIDFTLLSFPQLLRCVKLEISEAWQTVLANLFSQSTQLQSLHIANYRHESSPIATLSPITSLRDLKIKSHSCEGIETVYANIPNVERLSLDPTASAKIYLTTVQKDYFLRLLNEPSRVDFLDYSCVLNAIEAIGDCLRLGLKSNMNKHKIPLLNQVLLYWRTGGNAERCRPIAIQLIQAGAPINYRDSRGNSTPIAYAKELNDPELLTHFPPIKKRKTFGD